MDLYHPAEDNLFSSSVEAEGLDYSASSNNDPGMRRTASLSDDHSDFFLRMSMDECELRPTRSNSLSSGSKYSQDDEKLKFGQNAKPVLNPGRYKTELCRPFIETGNCKYGEKCQFAHGQDDIRGLPRHPKYKTEMCRTFHTTGLCPYGPRCHFIHNEDVTALMRIRDMKQQQMAQQIMQALKQQSLFPVKPVAAAVPFIATPFIPISFVPVPYSFTVNLPMPTTHFVQQPRPASIGSDGSPCSSPVGSPDCKSSQSSFKLGHEDGAGRFPNVDNFATSKRLPVFTNFAMATEEKSC